MVNAHPGASPRIRGPEGKVAKMESILKSAALMSLLLGAPVAFGQESADDEEAPPPTTISRQVPAPPEEELPIPTLTIDRVPPNTSMEFAVQVSYGSVAYFQDAVPAWIGFGVRGGWGKNFGLHRVGVAGTFTAEGDLGVHTLLALEPSVNWDFVSPQGVALGFGAGPALMYTNRNATTNTETSFEFAPSVAARVGWSQTWSRVGRRLFIYLEPKVRFTPEGITPLVALAVGSGVGR